MLLHTTYLFLFMITPIQAQEKHKTLYQQAPADWRAEVIPFPLGFAPSIPLKGVEELRFAPGMFKAEADDYFTYSFIWWINDKDALDSAQLEKYLLTYFSGLYQAVSKKDTKDTSAFSVMVQATSEPAWIKDATSQFNGSAIWLDPFVTEKPLKLNLQIAQWHCGEQTAVFFLISPQSEDHAVWAILRKQVAGRCDES